MGKELPVRVREGPASKEAIARGTSDCFRFPYSPTVLVCGMFISDLPWTWMHWRKDLKRGFSTVCSGGSAVVAYGTSVSLEALDLHKK